MQFPFYHQPVQHIIKNANACRYAYRLIRGVAEDLPQSLCLRKRQRTALNHPQQIAFPAFRISSIMPVESGKQHTVAGMKKIRFQFAALPAEGLLRTTSFSYYVCEKSCSSILKLRFNVFGIINANTGKGKIRVRGKSPVFSIMYFSFSEKINVAASINFSTLLLLLHLHLQLDFSLSIVFVVNFKIIQVANYTTLRYKIV